MRGTVTWEDPAVFFKALDQNCRYVVLRNHEGFFTSLTSAEHADIDLLCEDVRAVTRVTGAVRRRDDLFNPWNLSVRIGGRTVDLGVYSVRSRYYDPRWAARMLADRVRDERGFYRLTDRDYYESLIYHAAVHKPSFGQDYLARLSVMAGAEKTEEELRSELREYLRTNGYRCTYPYAPIRPDRRRVAREFGLDMSLPVLLVVGERTAERKLRGLIRGITGMGKDRA